MRCCLVLSELSKVWGYDCSPLQLADVFAASAYDLRIQLILPRSVAICIIQIAGNQPGTR